MKTFFIGLAGSSVLWGLVATFLFYFGVNSGMIHNETIVRYSTGHPVEYATIAMFWIGVVDLALKIFATKRERRALKRGALFPPKRKEKEAIVKVDEYLDTIAKARDVRGDSSYLTRLYDALNFLKFGGSPDDLDQELRYLADDAYDARDAEYGMIKTFVWAIPILGFLGTVLGITVALGNLDLTQLETSGDALAAGLKVAFDTTALALSLVFVVYFLQFFSRKQDAALANVVSRLVDSELKGRFFSETDLGVRAQELETTRRFLKSVSETFENATRAQTNIWTETMTNAAQKSAELSYEAANRFGTALDQRLTDGVASWTKTLVDAQRNFVEGTIQPTLNAASQRSAKLETLETKVAEQLEALRNALQATADVAAIEERLTRSLEKIAQVGEFEKTLNNLSATVELLHSKLNAMDSTASYPDVVRLDDALAKRASRRDEALAALDSLESSIFDANEADASRPLIFRDFETSDAIADDVAKAVEAPVAKEPEETPKPAAKRARSTASKKRSA